MASRSSAVRKQLYFPHAVPHFFRVNQSVKTLLLSLLITLVAGLAAYAADTLDADWNHPPTDARLRAYWWWLNGNVTSNAITRDLEEMKAKGFGGALICDANGAAQDGNAEVPHGPTFFSPEWRALFKHTLHEADRLGLEMSLNIQSGWNLGGPMVKPEDAPKKLTWSEMRVSGGTNLALKLEAPKSRDDFYRDLFVVAYQSKPVVGKTRQPIKNREQKALLREVLDRFLNFSNDRLLLIGDDKKIAVKIVPRLRGFQFEREIRRTADAHFRPR